MTTRTAGALRETAHMFSRKGYQYSNMAPGFSHTNPEDQMAQTPLTHLHVLIASIVLQQAADVLDTTDNSEVRQQIAQQLVDKAAAFIGK